MNWVDISAEGTVPADLAALAAGAGIDAHMLWAFATDFDGYLHWPDGSSPEPGDDFPVPVLVEIDPAASAAERQIIKVVVRRPGVYVHQEDFWTGTVRRSDLGVLPLLPKILRWRIGLPLIGSVDEQPGPITVPPLWADKDLPYVGIIDHGFAVAHAAFRVPGTPTESRVRALWDQDTSRRPDGYWKPAAGLGYGAQLTGEVLDRLIADTGDDEARVYAQLRYEPAQRRVSHGTHVLDLAAGNPSPLTPPGTTMPSDHMDWSGGASKAPIIAVQLPSRPRKDTSGSGLCVQVLDALHYIDSRVPSDRRVVVNLSDGAYGGPHDGQSMLERAVDEFLRARSSRMTLVVAAGNAHEDRGHVSAALAAGGGAATFTWRVLPEDDTPSFVEVWTRAAAADRTLALTLAGPGGAPPVTVALDGPARLLVRGGTVIGAVIPSPRSPNHPTRSMFLVALAPTWRRHRPKPVAPHGAWRITLRNPGASPVDLDAWTERDNPALADRGPRRQSYFEDDRCDPVAVDGQRTLGSLAGLGQAIVVGARYRRGQAFSGCAPVDVTAVARYSSRGPARAGAVPGPDLGAPSDESPASHGLRAAANRSGTTFRMDGTSVAAPLVTRRAVNHLYAQPKLTNDQLKALLVPTPQTDHGHDGRRGEVVPGHEPPPPVAI